MKLLALISAAAAAAASGADSGGGCLAFQGPHRTSTSAPRSRAAAKGRWNSPAAGSGRPPRTRFLVPRRFTAERDDADADADASDGEETSDSLDALAFSVVDTAPARLPSPATTTVDAAGAAAPIRLPPPPFAYDGSALAVDVFGDPYFYNGFKELADACRSIRETVLGNRTVDQVRKLWREPEAGIPGLEAIGASPSRVEAYLAAADVEVLLDEKKVVPLSYLSMKDHQLFKRRGAMDLPTPRALYESWETASGGEGTRASKLCLVTGSSGSGKTFFALRYLPDFLWDRDRHRHRVAIHLAPDGVDLGAGRRGGNGNGNGNGAPPGLGGDLDSYKAVVQCIHKALGELLDRRVTAKLRMHVCLIFDEAGDLSLDGAFQDRAFLRGLCLHLEAVFAESVVVVVAGTGITGANLNSMEDAYFFRLKPWQQGDLVEIMRRRLDVKLGARGGTTVESAVRSIFENPELRALTTNARSAYFLVRALADQCSSSVADTWTVLLDAWAPALASRVMRDYIASNGLVSIDVEDRRIISACIFQALEDTKSWEGGALETSSRYLTPSAFNILEGKLLAMARSLVTWNVELVGRTGTSSSPPAGGEDVTKKLVLVKGEDRALSVTPAIAMVLFVMSGVQFSLIRGWKGEEVVGALYAARQRILSVLKSRNVANADDWKWLRHELGKIRLLELRQQIQPLREQSLVPIEAGARRPTKKPSKARVRVPLVSANSILLNGEKASFADVIAPYVLIQAKHTSRTVVNVDIEKELRKCCLLKSCRDKLVLRGLLAVWRGDVAALLPAGAVARGPAPEPHALSSAYPENRVKYGDPVDPVAYAFIPRDGTSMKCNGPSQPSIGVPDFTVQDKITFLISTNARSIALKQLQPPKEESGVLSSDDGSDSDDEDDTDEDDTDEESYPPATEAGAPGSEPGRPPPFLLTPQLLTQDLQLDESRLDANQRTKWESVLRDVEPWVTIQFLFTTTASSEDGVAPSRSPSDGLTRREVGSRGR